MKATHYTIKNGVYTFHYSFSDWRQLINTCIAEQDIRWVLTKWDGKYKTSRSYDYKNGRAFKFNYFIRHCEELFGVFNPDHVVNPPEQKLFKNYGVLLPKSYRDN